MCSQIHICICKCVCICVCVSFCISICVHMAAAGCPHSLGAMLSWPSFYTSGERKYVCGLMEIHPSILIRQDVCWAEAKRKDQKHHFEQFHVFVEIRLVSLLRLFTYEALIETFYVPFVPTLLFKRLSYQYLWKADTMYLIHIFLQSPTCSDLPMYGANLVMRMSALGIARMQRQSTFQVVCWEMRKPPIQFYWETV